MSFMSGTNTELFYVAGQATQLNTFTTEDNLLKTLPEIEIPANFWYSSRDVGKSIHVRAWGRLGTTGTPTFTWNLRMLTSRTWSAGGVGVASAAITAGSTVTLAPWELEADITCRSIVAGATGLTLDIHGFIRGGTALGTTGGIYSIPAANTAFTVTLDATVAQFLFLSAACGTSNAANLIQVEMMKVYGDN